MALEKEARVHAHNAEHATSADRAMVEWLHANFLATLAVASELRRIGEPVVRGPWPKTTAGAP